ncbi:LuxR C-terminal-related transcriptional regulator [Streptomyces sp. NPDC059153]|uniref:helix-turn-helix transcriptional regulator n=1 Tax=unclassified Streptomyces TaxID=2593676 RepID=UPI003678443F
MVSACAADRPRPRPAATCARPRRSSGDWAPSPGPPGPSRNCAPAEARCASAPEKALTPQQREIVALAAAGLSNEQITEKLFLSPRTVSTHLYPAFPKLGMTSRAGLRDALERLHRP